MDISARIPNNLIFNSEQYALQSEKEHAALTLAGGLLGNIYVVTEIIDGVMRQSYSVITSQKCYKRELKKFHKQGMKDIKNTINTMLRTMNADFSRSIADYMDDRLSIEITKMRYCILFTLNKHKCPNSEFISWVILIQILIQFSVTSYDSIIEDMYKNVFPANYNSWFYQARNTAALHSWGEFTTLALKDIPMEIDLSENPNIQLSLEIIYKLIWSGELADGAIEAATESCGADDGINKVTKAINTLKLNKK